jgi:hypothetical protein
VRDRVGDESFEPVGGDFVEGFVNVRSECPECQFAR